MQIQKGSAMKHENYALWEINFVLCEENCGLCNFYLIHDEKLLWDLHTKKAQRDVLTEMSI